MTMEERNSWILENNDKIIKCIRGYCDRHSELEYEELYSDSIVYLIQYLDEKGIPNYGLNTLIGNYIQRIINSHRYEIPVDFFELIFLEDFDFENSSIVKAMINSAKLSEQEIALVKDIAVDGYTYKEAGTNHGLTYKKAREKYMNSLMRLRLAAVKLKCNLYS